MQSEELSGSGCAGYHHGEILQGLWCSADAPYDESTQCLVTLPICAIASRAHFTVTDAHRIEVTPPSKTKAGRAARLTMDALGYSHHGGRLVLECAIPTGLGLGSSSSDVLATMRAVCAALGGSLNSITLARLAVAAETASDPIMFDGTVLFAQREGRVLEDWGAWIPRYLLLSVDTDPGLRGVDTVSLAQPRGESARTDYAALIARARCGFKRLDSAEIAAVATRSAELNQRIVPLRKFRALCALGERSGCLGLQIAHSGTVAGLLFDPATPPESLEDLHQQLHALGMAPRGILKTGNRIGSEIC